MTLRYMPIRGDDEYIDFVENETYKNFLEEMKPKKFDYIEKIKFAIEPYISHK